MMPLEKAGPGPARSLVALLIATVDSEKRFLGVRHLACGRRHRADAFVRAYVGTRSRRATVLRDRFSLLLEGDAGIHTPSNKKSSRTLPGHSLFKPTPPRRGQPGQDLGIEGQKNQQLS